MSMKHIQDAVQQFASSDYNEFLVIKGEWGAGKTYFWNKIIQDALSNNLIKKKYYSYVSLFGVTNFDELREAIFISSVETTLYKENWENNKLRIGKLLYQVEDLPQIEKWTGGLLRSNLVLLLQDTLVCLDDIERRNNNLDIKTILGFISLLKEQKNCKVVLITNDRGLTEVEQNDFRTHSEKTIDLEIQFSPSSSDVFDYVFSRNDSNYDFIKSCCSKLDIKNIRTLQRIKRTSDILLSNLGNVQEILTENVLRTLIICIFSYYENRRIYQI